MILPRGEALRIAAEARTGRDKVEVHLGQGLVTPAELPESLLRYVVRTQDSVILDDALTQNRFSEDGYLRQRRSGSVLCLPLVKQAKLVGVLYLENNLAPHVFTPKRLAMLELLDERRRDFRIEKRYRREDDQVIWADLSSTLVPATGSAPAFFATVVVDIDLDDFVGQVMAAITTTVGCRLFLYRPSTLASRPMVKHNLRETR